MDAAPINLNYLNSTRSQVVHVRKVDGKAFLISQEGAVQPGESENEKGRGKDLYANLDELKEHCREGIDYSILSENRRSCVTIVSPHGGLIETGTTELGRAIAGGDYNFFAFEALRRQNPHDLHVTSEHFSDPVLTELLSSSKVAVSIHGRADREDTESIWLGGLNLDLKKLIGKQLKEQGFKVEMEPPALKGISSANFVNRPELRGVQLELPQTLRKRLVPNPGADISAEANKFSNAVRNALSEYASNQ